jgi:Protein of unknown function (DUF3352)
MKLGNRVSIEKLKSSRLLSLGAAVLIVAGGGLTYYHFSRASSANLQTGAKLVPQDATLTVSLSTDPQQWQQLQAYGTSESQKLLQGVLAQLTERFLTENGYDYQQDIQPWIGDEVTIALLPTPEATPETSPLIPGQLSGAIAILPIEDGEAAKKLWEKAQSSNEWQERKYKGVTIRQKQGTNTSKMPLALVLIDRNFLVITNRPDVAERTINAYQSNDAIASTPGYTAAWQSLRGDRAFARVYVNLPTATRELSNSSSRPLDAEILAKVSTQGLVTTLNLQAEGILFRGISWLQPKSQQVHDLDNRAKEMPTRFPDSTVLLVSGTNLEQLWKNYLVVAQDNPRAPLNPTWLRSALQESVALDWDKDLLPWMTGEFALGLVHTQADDKANFPGSITVMVQTNQRSQADEVLARLDRTMQDKYKFKVEKSTVQNRDVVNWIAPQFQGMAVTRGWLSGDVAFLSVGAPIADTFIPKPAPSLADTNLFKTAVPRDLQPNNGHFFWDLEQTLNAEGFDLIQFPPAQKAILGAIRAIGVTGAVRDERTTEYEVFVQMQKEKN